MVDSRIVARSPAFRWSLLVVRPRGGILLLRLSPKILPRGRTTNEGRGSLMTQATTKLPLLGTLAGFRRFSVAEYHRLTELGILTEDDNLELLEGYLIHKMSRNPPHDSVLHTVLDLLHSHLPSGWKIRIQSAITLPDS